jgi:hypothetical protein
MPDRLPVQLHYIEIMWFFVELFRPPVATKQFWRATKPFFACDAELRKRRMVIKPATTRRTAPAAKPGDRQMRTLSFLLAFAFMLAGPSMAGSTDNTLPGIGTFAYNGSPIAITAPQSLVVAAR